MKKAIQVFLLIIILTVINLTSFYFYNKFSYTSEKTDLFKKGQTALIFEGNRLKFSPILEKSEVLLPVSFLQDKIDPQIFVDQPTNSIIITTKNNILQFKDKEVNAFVNKFPYKLHFPVVKKKDYYVPVDPLSEIYPMKVVSDEKGVVVVYQLDKNYKFTTLKEGNEASIRLNADRKSPITSTILPNEKVFVYKHDNEKHWTFVQKENGYFGWIEDKFLNPVQSEKLNSKLQSKKDAVKSIKSPINLTWESIFCCNPDTSKFPPMPGVNVISPTWFTLANANGDIENKAGNNYLKWAKGSKMQVWALFSNDFAPIKTDAFLNNFNARMNAIKQLAALAKLYQLDGINIDFEGFQLKDKNLFIQFIRELTPYLHKEGIIVSADITPPGGSDSWSKVYDRKVLAETVDYLMLMSYDEYPGNSKIAGSVASLSWTEQSIKDTLKEVPNNKLLLGVPFYTRLWSQSNGKVTSKAMGMDTADAWVKQHNLTPVMDPKTSQDFVSYKDPSGIDYKMWLEDQKSVSERITLMEKYKLVGIASWTRAFSNNSNWVYIDQLLHK